MFFDVETGEVKLNYGGVHEPLKVTNVNGETVEVYELGLRIKEIRELDFDSRIFFFMCGDLWENDIRQQQVFHKWCLMNIEMELDELMALGTSENINAYINEEIAKNIPGGQHEQRINFFLFDSNWIVKDYFNWENNISLSTNRNFSQVALINQPSAGAIGKCLPSFYLNGVKFKDPTKKTLEVKDLVVPYHRTFKDYFRITHGRNAIIKDEIFYDIHVNGVTKVICLR